MEKKNYILIYDLFSVNQNTVKNVKVKLILYFQFNFV